jgi:outer membrane lipoprotein-sorting protein
MRLPPRRNDRRRALLRIATAGAAAVPWCAAWPATAFGLPQLMQLLASVKAGEAKFSEERRIAMLDQVQRSSGRLSFRAPDVFVRETLKPRHERLAVDGNTLTMTQGTRSRTLALDATPEALVIVEAIRGTLTGNRETLERYFRTQVSGTAERWTLELEPRDARLRGQVASVLVAGRQAAVLEVQVLLADGDRSVMKIEPLTAAP